MKRETVKGTDEIFFCGIERRPPWRNGIQSIRLITAIAQFQAIDETDIGAGGRRRRGSWEGGGGGRREEERRERRSRGLKRQICGAP